MTSDKFKKYTSIENHYQESFLVHCPDVITTWCVTEKIHGANFQVYYDGENFLVGSRNHFIDSNDNFYGLNDIIKNYKNSIMQIWHDMVVDKPITLYGEVYGDGIQKGIKYSKIHKIKFFDMKVGEDYLPYLNATKIFTEYHLPYVSVRQVIEGSLKAAIETADTRFNSEVAEGEYASLEDNLCEGVVIKPYFDEFKSDRGARVIIKKKNEEFWEKSHTPKAKVKDDRFVDYKTDENAVMVYINQNRFDSVFSKDQYIKTNFGDFIKAYTEDVVEDAAKDNVEFKNLKNIHNIIARTTKVEYFNRVAA